MLTAGLWKLGSLRARLTGDGVPGVHLSADSCDFEGVHGSADDFGLMGDGVRGSAFLVRNRGSSSNSEKHDSDPKEITDIL